MGTDAAAEGPPDGPTGWTGRWQAAMLPTYAPPDLFVASGRGCRVTGIDGETYLDFLAGLAVASTGHAHPRVADAIAAQARRSLHHSNLYGMPGAVLLAERVLDKAGLDKAFLCNSGTEANEVALKVVRRHAHRDGGPGDAARVLAFTNSFHGRTLGALTLTGQPKYHAGFGPLVPGIDHVPFNDADALAAAFDPADDAAGKGPVAAVVYEAVQGEGGIVPMEPAFAAALSDLAADHGALLVADEVQTGVHRTGPFLASADLDLAPDVVTLAKGLGSGFPVACALLTDALADRMRPGDHGCTFGGGPLAAAAANATLDVVEAEDLGANASKMGELLAMRLADALGGHLAMVRGRGLLVGAVLEAPVAPAVRKEAQALGLLVGNVGDHVVRISPPLVVGAGEVEEAVGILAEAVDAVAGAA